VVDCSGVDDVVSTAVVFFVMDVFFEVEDDVDDDDDDSEDKLDWTVDKLEESPDVLSPDEVELFASCRRSISLRACSSIGSAETKTTNNIAITNSDNNITQRDLITTNNSHTTLRNRDGTLTHKT